MNLIGSNPCDNRSSLWFATRSSAKMLTLPRSYPIQKADCNSGCTCLVTYSDSGFDSLDFVTNRLMLFHSKHVRLS
jgi:hypothetical protein